MTNDFTRCRVRFVASDAKRTAVVLSDLRVLAGYSGVRYRSYTAEVTRGRKYAEEPIKTIRGLRLIPPNENIMAGLQILGIY